MENEKIPYYVASKLLWQWRLRDGADGCKIVPNIVLSMDMAPPPLPEQPAPKTIPTKPTPKPPKPDTLDQMVDDIAWVFDAFSRFKTWLDTPTPPKTPKPAPVAKKAGAQAAPTFDIQEIPGAMRKLWMPVSATLMERWFAGRLNYSPTDDDEREHINQDGKPYPPDMYDTTTIKLDWVLKYERAKVQYDALQDHAHLMSPKALNVLGKRLAPFRVHDAQIDALKLCRVDIKQLHKHFQFQLTSIESSFGQKLRAFINQHIDNNGVPDDLTGALGSFNFCAAIGDAHFNRDADRATITSIIIYIKDNYTFTDKKDEPSQYLGHWNRNSVAIVPATSGAAIGGIPWIDYPIAVGDMRVRDSVYYPVRNSSFRRWQQHHQRGGDFVIFSDYRCIRLRQPIELKFS